MAAPTLKHLIARIRAPEKAAVGLLAQGKAQEKEKTKASAKSKAEAPAKSKAEAPIKSQAKAPSKSKSTAKRKAKAPVRPRPDRATFVAAEESGPEIDTKTAASDVQIGDACFGRCGLTPGYSMAAPN